MRKISVVTFLVLTPLVAFFVGCGQRGEEARINTLLAEAQAYKEAGLDGKAADVYESITILYPDSELAKEAEKKHSDCLKEYYFKEAKHKVAQDDLVGATEALQKLLALDPKHVEGNYAVGWVYMRVAMENLMALEDPSIPSWQKEIYYIQVEGLMELAESQFQLCLKLDESNYSGHKGMAHIYAAQNDMEKALKEIMEAVELAPDAERKALCGEVLAQFYLGGGEVGLAVATMDDIIKENPNRGESYLTYGAIYETQGDYDKAIELFEEGLGKDFNELSLKGRILAEISYCYGEKKEYEKAKEALGKALIYDLDNPDYILQYTQLYSYSLPVP